jgi:hypothetical protein
VSRALDGPVALIDGNAALTLSTVLRADLRGHASLRELLQVMG